MINDFSAMIVSTSDQVYCYHFNPVGSTVAITDIQK